jgi:hypothetical protein
VSPLAIVSGQETSMSLKGRNLSAPGTKLVLISPFSGCCGVLFTGLFSYYLSLNFAGFIALVLMVTHHQKL